MEIIGDRKFIELPGNKSYQLPPLFIPSVAGLKRLDRVVDMAQQIVVSEDMIPGADAFPENPVFQQYNLELAIQLTESYMNLVLHWRWGENILGWVRQCEITFESRPDLRHLIHADVWPHAGRSSFIRLLEDKKVPTQGVDMKKAVGLRLTFRQPPPISCFSNQFLFYLKDSVGNSTYQAWASKNPDPVSSFPPERFTLQVTEL